MNVANPSPVARLGVQRARVPNRARKARLEKLVLALVHHLVISANVPLAALVRWLAEITREVVIEFISKDDANARRLLLNKDDTYTDYNREAFEQYLQQSFRIQVRAELPGGTRSLYRATAVR